MKNLLFPGWASFRKFYEKELIEEASKIESDGNKTKFVVDAAVKKAKRDLAKGK